MQRRQRPIWAGASAKAWPQRLSFLLLVVFGFALMVLARPENAWLGATRMAAIDALAPVIDMAGRPIAATKSLSARIGDYFSLAGENAELRRENSMLEDWQRVARNLERQNAALRDMLRFVPPPDLHFLTAAVIADTSSGFSRSVILRAGRADGVTPDQVAMTGAGLAGRVLEIGEDSARILLVTDVNARIPVRFESSRLEAMAFGDNSDLLRLDYLSAGADPKIGDRLVTSGQGGLYPPDLPVGEIVAIDDEGIRVRPYVDFARLEYLRLVDFALPGLLAPGGSAD